MAEDKSSSEVTNVVERIEPLIHSLPQDKQNELRQIITTSIQFQGPLPPPGMLEAYDKIIPNGANRLLILLEKQTDHRIAVESGLVTSKIKVTTRGQLFAFSLSIFFGVITAFLGYFGHDWLAASIGVTTIIGLAVVFVLGKEPGQTPSIRPPTPTTKTTPLNAKKRRTS